MIQRKVALEKTWFAAVKKPFEPVMGRIISVSRTFLLLMVVPIPWGYSVYGRLGEHKNRPTLAQLGERPHTRNVQPLANGRDFHFSSLTFHMHFMSGNGVPMGQRMGDQKRIGPNEKLTFGSFGKILAWHPITDGTHFPQRLQIIRQKTPIPSQTG